MEELTTILHTLYHEHTVLCITVYMSGFVTTWLMAKYIRNKSNDNNWTAVIHTFVSSLFSWFSVFIFIACILLIVMRNTDKKPPKFL